MGLVQRIFKKWQKTETKTPTNQPTNLKKHMRIMGSHHNIGLIAYGNAKEMRAFQIETSPVQWQWFWLSMLFTIPYRKRSYWTLDSLMQDSPEILIYSGEEKANTEHIQKTFESWRRKGLRKGK